jgi:glycosyltransferase involved in cell wall biosynthesis
MPSPLVSVNIPTLNSARTLHRCLSALKKQDYASLEVIIIDAYSTDKSQEIAKTLGARVILERGLTKQRLKGISQSKGDYILLLDSDQVVSLDLIKKCVRKLEVEKDIDALILPEVPVTDVINSIAHAQSSYVRLAQTDSRVLHGTALPRFFRAGIIRAIKPPRREIGYFDHAWIYRRVSERGATVSSLNAPIYHHEFNWASSVIKKFYKYYGNYFVPALIEDWPLVLSKSLPKPLVTNASSAGESIGLLMLFGVKVISTYAGVISSVFHRKH